MMTTMNSLDAWLDAQRINGGPHGFEVIGRERMQQVWCAAQAAVLELERARQQKPLCYVRMLNGEIDWAEDCLSLDGSMLLCDEDEDEKYSIQPLYAGPILGNRIDTNQLTHECLRKWSEAIGE